MPTITNLVEIQPKSMDLMAKIYGQYTESDEAIPRFFPKGVVLHLHPDEDTLDENDQLNGYEDSVLCTLKVYDQATKVVYSVKNRDCITLDPTVHSFIRIFKDLSTMVVVRSVCNPCNPFAWYYSCG